MLFMLMETDIINLLRTEMSDNPHNEKLKTKKAIHNPILQVGELKEHDSIRDRFFPIKSKSFYSMLSLEEKRMNLKNMLIHLYTKLGISKSASNYYVRISFHTNENPIPNKHDIYIHSHDVFNWDVNTHCCIPYYKNLSRYEMDDVMIQALLTRNFSLGLAHSENSLILSAMSGDNVANRLDFDLYRDGCDILISVKEGDLEKFDNTLSKEQSYSLSLFKLSNIYIRGNRFILDIV